MDLHLSSVFLVFWPLKELHIHTPVEQPSWAIWGSVSRPRTLWHCSPEGSNRQSSDRFTYWDTAPPLEVADNSGLAAWCPGYRMGQSLTVSQLVINVQFLDITVSGLVHLSSWIYSTCVSLIKTRIIIYSSQFAFKAQRFSGSLFPH